MRSSPSPVRGLTLEGHDSLSTLLVSWRLQAEGVRRLLRGALGKSSASAQAAATLLEAVDHLQQALLAEIDATYGEQAPAVTRTRYSTGAAQQAQEKGDSDATQ